MRKTFILFIALIALPLFAQGATSVTGAGRATLPEGASLEGVSLSAMRFAIGVDVPGDDTAAGDFQATLLGAGRTIVVEGKAASGSISAAGVSVISGTCSLDLGDGTPAQAGVPFTVTVSEASLTLVIGGTTLPAAPVTGGSVRVR